MRKCQFTLAVLFISITLAACAPSGPSTIEILDSLETEVNERDMEGVMALFAEDAVFEELYQNVALYGTKEIERMWKDSFFIKDTREFRDISVDGDTATFIWATVFPVNTKLYPTIIEVQNGKITYMAFIEDATEVPTGEE